MPLRSWRKPFAGPIGQGELAIPAIRGVGGSLLYFLDGAEGQRVRRRSTSSPTRSLLSGAGPRACSAIDHLAQVVPQTEFLGWILFYRAILGLQPEARTDLNDPRGLIVSRALSNPDRSLRLPLNASQAQASAAGRFIERTAGAGAQHIAFACRRRLRRRRSACRTSCSCRSPRTTTRTSPPASALDDAFVERLRADSILYDRVGEGEFFHFFTRTINGLFFEVLERRGGYDRYGEANAPARLAAQALLDRSLGEAITELHG